MGEIYLGTRCSPSVWLFSSSSRMGSKSSWCRVLDDWGSCVVGSPGYLSRFVSFSSRKTQTAYWKCNPLPLTISNSSSIISSFKTQISIKYTTLSRFVSFSSKKTQTASWKCNPLPQYTFIPTFKTLKSPSSKLSSVALVHSPSKRHKNSLLTV